MKKTKPKLSKLKYTAYELRAFRQIPYQLVLEINDLTDNSSIDLVNLLMQLSEHYLRIKGYYKKYPQVEQSANAEIKKAVASLK